MTSNQSMFLLWLTIMKQSQSTKDVIQNVTSLWEKLNIRDIYSLSLAEIQSQMKNPKNLHRFPNVMSENIYCCIQLVQDKYGKDASQVFAKDAYHSLKEFRGIGNHKAEICLFFYDLLESNTNYIPSLKRIDGCVLVQEDIMEEISAIKSI